jgi:hypothetical protein
VKVLSAALLALGLLPALPVPSAAKTILISDSLAANSDKLNVKQGAQWMGRIFKWSFGDYAVTSSKHSGTSSTSARNLLHTKTDSTSSESFSFMLGNKTTDVAFVDAAHNVNIQSLQKFPLGRGFFLGSDEVALESDNFTAFITINGDTSDTWALFIGGTTTPGPTADTRTMLSGGMFLTNGSHRIKLVCASSNKNGCDPQSISMFSIPAVGFEFFEDGHSIGAVQYFGGTFGVTYLVWLRRDSDPRLKLILAAAMTAILQVETSRPMAPAED